MEAYERIPAMIQSLLLTVYHHVSLSCCARMLQGQHNGSKSASLQIINCCSVMVVCHMDIRAVRSVISIPFTMATQLLIGFCHAVECH